MQPLTWLSKRERDTLLNESPALRRREPTWMGSCTIMPMIPIARLSGGNFRAAIHAMTFATCTHTDLWGMDEGSFQNDCCHHAGKAPMALQRRGGAVIFLVFQSIWGSDEAGNHDPLAGSDSASIFIFFHPKAQHICYNNSNIVKF